MAREIWLGPVLGNNRERLLARCAEYVSQGQAERLLYIAASHPLLDLVTEKLLDGTQAPGVWGEFPIYLFRGLVRRILLGAVDTETGKPLPPRVAIDREELPLRRSLISQIIKQLGAHGRLRAIKPLANRDGCVNTIASLIGELQRAGKTPGEFQNAVEERAAEFGIEPPGQSSGTTSSPRSQLDFDREVALIYAAYAEALDRFNLTDEDADQLRALQILRGEIDGRAVSLPWLNQVELLVLDGFFDFTPVQGEILKHLIPVVPNAIVNLNGDARNEDIFRPFQSTIEHLESIAGLETRTSAEMAEVVDALAPLRGGLFNVTQVGNLRDGLEEKAQLNNLRHITLIECGDREVEIRAIAKEIKRLILTKGYKLSDIALVVRERAAYADTILRVCADESIPANLERRVEAVETPAMRACGKLFQLLQDTTREHIRNPKASDLAHLVKTGYFRASANALPELTKVFDQQYASLLAKDKGSQRNETSDQDEQRRVEGLSTEICIGRWLPDTLENVIAYVGSELRANAWTERARRLIDKFPSPEAARSLIAGSASESEDAAAAAEDESPPDEAPVRRQKPAPIHPAAIAWTVILIEHLQDLLSSFPEAAPPEELRGALMSVLDRLEFAKQVRRSFLQAGPAADIPQAALDVRGLESLRRALAAAVRSFHYAAQIVSEARASARTGASSLTVGPQTAVALAAFIDEVERSLRSQVLAIGAANRDGLQVLEATDVRGLRFRAVFIAGLIESGFPLRTSRDWLYPHEERVRLQKHGIFLEDISTDTLLKEEHYFYQVACRATERLYLTRPLATASISETVASYYIEELKRVVDPNEFETVQVRGDLDTRELTRSSTASELSTFLVRQSQQRNREIGGRRAWSRSQIKDLLAQAETHGYLSNSAVRRVAIERERNSVWFGSRDGEIRKLILDQVLLYELRLQAKTKARGIRPAYFELAFGRASQASDPSSSPDYLKVARSRAGDETALFQGQIDRVDINEREGIAVAYDYKLSQGAKLEDIETGRQVQIPIYLAALEQIFLPGYQLAGGGYYKLKSRGPRLNQGIYPRLFADCTDTTRATQVDDHEMARVLEQVRRRVWEFIDAMRGGHFRVRPALGKLTCKFCDYSAVCRYEPYRISQKRG